MQIKVSPHFWSCYIAVWSLGLYRLAWQFVMASLGGKVMVTPDLAMLYCYTSANGWQYMTIYDIHDTFMVIYVMYYTKCKQHHHPYSIIIHKDGLDKLKLSNIL